MWEGVPGSPGTPNRPSCVSSPGTPDPGEAKEQTALREVREETGLDVLIEGYIEAEEHA